MSSSGKRLKSRSKERTSGVPDQLRPSSSNLEPLQEDSDPEVSLEPVGLEAVDSTNPYHRLARTNWYDYTPAQIRGIAAVAAQLAPGSATKYCQIAVSTDRTAEDPDRLRTMVYNGKRWVGHDLERPIHTLKKRDVNKSKEGLPLASPTTKPARCPGCSNYRKRRSVGTDEDSSDEEMSDIVSSAQNTPIRHPPQLNPTQSAVAPTTTTVVTTYASPKRLRQTPSTPGSSSAQSRAQSPATGLISGLGRFESQPPERMEGVQDELILHQEEEIGASEEVGTTTPLDSSASLLEQTPQPMEPITQLTDQTPLNRRVVLPLKRERNPSFFASL